MPYKQQPAIAISNLSLIETDPQKPAVPAPQYFPEPEHTWCYYYQKADLARQKGDWQEAARLGDEAIAEGKLPNTASEWPVLIEAYGHVKNWDQAVKLTEDAYANNILLRPALCTVWDRISRSSESDEGLAKIKYIRSYIGCGKPVDSENK